jgi:Ca2+-binding RTX toxin-like protein
MYTDRRVLSAGQTVVYRARVEDSAGNQSASANTYVVSLSPIAPVISLHDMSVLEGDSGPTTYNFEVILSRPSIVPVNVVYQFIPLVSGDAALFGVDLNANSTSQLLTFSPGVISRTIAFSITGDSVSEPDESFRIQLSNPVNAIFADGASSISAMATIINDDAGKTNTISSTGNFQGSNSDDVLIGLGEANQIDGLAGNDVITGGPGADFLSGGPGSDSFVYPFFSDSTLSAFDTITEFNVSAGDKIDLPSSPAVVFNRGLIFAANLFNALQTATSNPTNSSNPIALLANEAVVFVWGTTPRNRSTFLCISDGIDANFNGDLLIRMPANPGTIDLHTFL